MKIRKKKMKLKSMQHWNPICIATHATKIHTRMGNVHTIGKYLSEGASIANGAL